MRQPISIPIERLRALLSYDRESGHLTWLPRPASVFKTRGAFVTWNKRYAGSSEHHVDTHSGYMVLCIEGRRFYAHRVAWALATGSWPVNVIDHVDGVRTNNKLANLRDVCERTNQQNQRRPHVTNKVGLMGVSFSKQRGMFASFIKHEGRTKLIGYFADAEAAHAAYVQAKRAHHAGCHL